MIAIKKKLTKFYPLVLSRHPTHSILRLRNRSLPLLPFRSVVRFGSPTEAPDRVECNTVAAIANSSNKLLMKQCFTEADIFTADWWRAVIDLGNIVFVHKGIANRGTETIDKLQYPIVAKQIYGSRGNGNTLLKTKEELENWLVGKNLKQYIFEKFYNYNKEYRLHVTEEGCFYTCRKMLKQDTPEGDRWFRNDKNSVWIIEENPDFDKPSNWNNVVEHSVRALKAVGLDVGAVDLRIQSTKDVKGRVRENPEFIVIEINSAPSFGEITSQKYIEEIPKILMRKYATKNKL